MSKIAGEVAQELRRIADALDKEPETSIAQPMISFYCDEYYGIDKGKANFLNLARLLPKPLKKEVNDHDYVLTSDSTGTVWIRVKINRNAVCTLIQPAQPAVYDCEPILSQQEFEGVG